jgi:hypothetical protein
MEKKRGKKFMWLLMLLAVLVLLIIIFLSVPYSPLKSGFNDEVSTLISNTRETAEVFTSEEIQRLPTPVREYFETCGYIGTPKMEYIKTLHKDVDFLLSADKPYTKIGYTQYTFVKEPARLAFIETSLFGILPFQGLDYYVSGKGGMKGVIAKAFTLFHETGFEMDSANLINCLSECLLVPNIALQDYIAWESIDDTHAKGTISYYGISASGIFTFSENGEMLSFSTNERWETGTDGTKTQPPWSMAFSEYKETNGIKQPTRIQTIWHYEKGDSIYFDSRNPVIEYH